MTVYKAIKQLHKISGIGEMQCKYIIKQTTGKKSISDVLSIEEMLLILDEMHLSFP